MSSLKEFAVVFSQNVAWGDMDAVGHVNNVMYYRYIESARVEYLTKIGAIGQGLSAVIASSSCRFLRPVFFPDVLEIGVQVIEVRNSGFRMNYVLFSTKQNHIVATGDAIAVMVNASTLGKAALPAELRQRIYALEQTVGNDLIGSEAEERIGLTIGLTNAARSLRDNLRDNLRENIKEGRETLKENIESIVPRLVKRD
ncbi:MAG: acyl-CoA thioesterase [Candidatus Saccharibacteria bacterium]|nr:acyl-CoA thioesterase [Moraxellaceae bacterium]